MSLWGFLGAGLAYLLMTFAFVFGGIFWLCAEGRNKTPIIDNVRDYCLHYGNLGDCI